MQTLEPPPISGSEAPDHAAVLKEKIRNKSAAIAVVGVGYVGLPLAVEKAKVGFPVCGFDRNAIRVAQINRGMNYIRDVSDVELSTVVSAGKLSASSDFSTLGEYDVIVICVPTPLTANRDPDISYIQSVAREIAQHLRPGQLVSLESTTYPGTTEEVLLPILAGSGLAVGVDFFLSFSPERVDPGNKRYTTKNTNKVVGGVTAVCLDVARTFYEQTILKVVCVSSPRVAEMTKVFENAFRAVNIAMVNEMALLCDRMGINIWEVIDTAATKPFGIMRFDPGPGVGGHCIPLDPFYLTWKARQYDFHTRFIELAGEINVLMPYFVREKITRALNQQGQALKNARIILIGISYKRDTDDWRESPALKVLDLLENDGAFVDYHDLHVPSFQDARGRLRSSVPIFEDSLAAANCVVVTTDHSDVDWQHVVTHARLVVDTRNATKNITSHREKIILL
ncbi:MAG: nucleotide sugar dehydrogenase [Candidatus Eremiobacteraeota bacterium]|nr:nucleotide sugar dehydrogenase [Candidatus Eremiobacteraeota bacterium]